MLGASVLVAASLLVSGCGDSAPSAANTLPPGYYITISNMSFSPLNLEAPAGATITVLNRDTMAHSVTQQAAAGAFVVGAPAGTTPFDTGLFTGSKTFSLPTGLADGTVLYYFCTSHTSLMTTPNGTITIRAVAPPVPGGPYDPGGTGY
jgi:plastocyanin